MKIAMIRSTASILLTFAFAAGSAVAAGDPERGLEKSQVCQACHGPDGTGVGDPQYPIIAGQYADYLAYAMRSYKTGERTNVVMQGFMQTLSDEDIDDLAAYYAAQKGPLDDLSHLK